jgi:hypothetical protein
MPSIVGSMESDLLTALEAAAYLKVCLRTFRSFRIDRVVYSARCHRYERATLDAFLKSRLSSAHAVGPPRPKPAHRPRMRTPAGSGCSLATMLELARRHQKGAA